MNINTIDKEKTNYILNIHDYYIFEETIEIDVLFLVWFAWYGWIWYDNFTSYMIFEVVSR